MPAAMVSAYVEISLLRYSIQLCSFLFRILHVHSVGLGFMRMLEPGRAVISVHANLPF